MDCRTALEILEVVRPDSGDLSDPEFAEAAAHIESHAECREEFHRRQQLDRDIGVAVRDVSVPDDLRARLLVSLAEAADDSSAAAAVSLDSETQTTGPRRSWMKLVVGVAACVVAGVITWQYLPGGSDPINVAQLPAQLEDSLSNGSLNVAGLPAFSGSYEPEIPLTWQTGSSRVSYSRPKAYSVPERPDLTVAIYELSFRGRSGPVTGYLLVLPAELADKLPTATAIGSVGPRYHGPIAVSQSWISGGAPGHQLVYVCVMPGGVDQLNELVKRLRLGSA